MAIDKFPDESSRMLFKAFLSLASEAECQAFLEDLCTMPELKSMAQRLAVAVLLRDNKTYTEITEATGVSAATISRVSRAIEYGAGGYGPVLDRLKETND